MHDLMILNFTKVDTPGPYSQYILKKMVPKMLVRQVFGVNRLMQLIAIRIYNYLWNKRNVGDAYFETLAYHAVGQIEGEIIGEQEKFIESGQDLTDDEFLLSLTLSKIDVSSGALDVHIAVKDQASALSICLNTRE